MKKNTKKYLKKILILLLVLIVIYAGILIFTKPSNDRDWAEDQAVLATADIHGNFVTIHNIRNFKYKSTDDYSPDYYDKVFDLDKIKSVDFILEPFSEFAGAAHTFLSFGFEDGDYVSISIEIRKEKGEEFSTWKGLLNRYELMYVIADEKDAILLRSKYREDKVYVYPVKTNEAKKQALFLDMLQSANKLKEKPKFYNTLSSTCTTNIVKHINTITPEKVPFSYKVLMPGFADELAFDLDLIDTDLPLEKAREKYLVNDRAEKYADSDNFSEMIRK